MKTGDRRLTAGAAITAALLFLPVVGPGSFTGPGASSWDGLQELPAGVTMEKIAQGEQLYQSSGCVTCHGADGKGKPGMTKDPTDGTWQFVEGGSFQALVAVVKDGLTPDKTGGMPMPAASARNLTDAQVQALAAYMWKMGQPSG